MFNNIGKKIKVLAMVICVIGIIGSVVWDILYWITYSKAIQSAHYYGYYSSSGSGAGFGAVLVGILIPILGTLFSWIGSFFMYGYGQLIEKTEENNYYLANINAYLRPSAQQGSRPALSSVAPLSPPSAKESTGWVCPKCGTKNSASSVSCSGCGHYK